jgi:DNA-binding FadR family transcriptional regulator
VQMTAALNVLLRHRRVSMATDPVSNERSLRDHWRILDAIRARRLTEAQEAVLAVAEDAQRHVVEEARTIIRDARERSRAERSPRDNDAGVRVSWTT